MSLSLSLTRYRIHYQVITPIKLPEYAGSAWRGAFGHALKNIACFSAARNKGLCRCDPAESCLYRQLFDPPMRVMESLREQDVPTPMVIEPDDGGKVLRTDESAYLDMVLIGQAAQSQLAIIQLAWMRALHDGVGTADEQGKRGQARLINIELLDQPSRILPENPQNVHLKIISPMRLQHHGELVIPSHLTAAILLWAMIRRYHLVHELYGQAQTLDHQAIGDALSLMEIDHRLHWMEWTRYSNRQKREMKLSGMTGRVLLKNIPDVLWPYIYFGQWIHAGKNSMFGLGHYQVVDEAWKSKIIEGSGAA